MVSDKVEPVAVVVDKLKTFAKSTQHFTNGVLDKFGSYRRRHPIEILKRLQREAFTDIMKLRDRQDKLERLLSLKSSKSSLFDESRTRVRGEIEALGLVLMADQNHQEARDRTGIKSGVSSRFTFETTVRDKDLLSAEFVARGETDGVLSLAKVIYAVNVNDWCSLVAVPLGAKCSDANHSFTGPPLLNKHIGSGIGLTVKKSNCIASLAQFVTQLESSTFGQVTYQLAHNTKVSLLGLNKRTPKFSSQSVSLSPAGDGSFGSAAMVLESDLDSSTKIGGWVEISNLESRYLQWGVSVSDLPDDDLGWGLKVGGSVDGSNVWDHCQVEAFSKVKVGEKFLLQPSVMYVKDGFTRFPALTMKSTWSF